MKGLLFIISSLVIGSAYADDFIKCDLKITNNKVSCSLFSKCPEKILRESTTQIDIITNDFDETVGKVNLKKIILHPGTKKESKNNVVLFKDDPRDQKVLEKKEIDMVQYDIKSSIEYRARKEGNRSIIKFKTPNYTFDMTLTGNNAHLSGYMLLNESNIVFHCTKMDENQFQDLEAKKEAIQNYQNEKSIKSASRQ